MPQQLVLIHPEGDDWYLDEQTREVGLRGIAEARRILTEAARRAGQRTAA
ncbi:MAG TPA: hypothetical protein VFV02_02460 [Acidimicrobiales bacterium]|nr:hypothetical protein [Acidimicrobiales bacterium]